MSLCTKIEEEERRGETFLVDSQGSRGFDKNFLGRDDILGLRVDDRIRGSPWPDEGDGSSMSNGRRGG